MVAYEIEPSKLISDMFPAFKATCSKKY
jgi:hypothetical protein